MPKLLKIALFFLTIMMVLQGCNNDQDEVSSPPEEAPVEQETKKNNQQNGETEHLFPFTSFDLDVDYKDNQSYDVDYDNERDGMEAEIQDKRNNENIRLSGDEAFEQLQPLFERLTFDQNTAEDKVISEVLDVFNLDTNFTNFELDIEFTDATEKEYRG